MTHEKGYKEDAARPKTGKITKTAEYFTKEKRQGMIRFPLIKNVWEPTK